MKLLRLVVLLLAAAAPAAAQTPKDDPVAVVRRLFDAMRMQDTATMRSTFRPGARLLGTGTNQQGQPAARVAPPDGWIRGIGNSRNKPDERIYDPELRVDGNLATVWTRYEFFSGENFTHCGYDAFHLVNIGGQWKIVQTGDTQRRNAEACGRGTAPAAQNQPTAADTAAVVAALQRVFDGMRTRDTVVIKDAFIADGVVAGIGPDSLRAALVGPWAQGLANSKTQGEFRERMQNPEVRISDNLATVWTWYDFHIGDRFTHCGVDAAMLARTSTGWKVVQITYTTRPSPCTPPGRN